MLRCLSRILYADAFTLGSTKQFIECVVKHGCFVHAMVTHDHIYEYHIFPRIFPGTREMASLYIIKVDHREIKAWLLQHGYDLERLRGSAGSAAARFEKILYSRLCHEIRTKILRGGGESTAEVLSRISFLGIGFPEAFDWTASTH